MAKINIQELSLTISELVNLDADRQKLIESAIDRAISAQDAQAIVGGANPSLLLGKVVLPIEVGFVEPIKPDLR